MMWFYSKKGKKYFSLNNNRENRDQLSVSNQIQRCICSDNFFGKMGIGGYTEFDLVVLLSVQTRRYFRNLFSTPMADRGLRALRSASFLVRHPRAGVIQSTDVGELIRVRFLTAFFNRYPSAVDPLKDAVVFQVRDGCSMA